MSVNRERPHVFVFPEDDANRQLANAFHKEVDWRCIRQMQVLAEAGGWREVLRIFTETHIPEMERNHQRFMVLLIDLDGNQNRLEDAKQTIPDHLSDRVFVLGAQTEPEDLKRERLGSYEDIGKAMAQDCRDNTDTIWSHPLLRHNATEIARLRELVRGILF